MAADKNNERLSWQLIFAPSATTASANIIKFDICIKMEPVTIALHIVGQIVTFETKIIWLEK